MYSEMLAPNTPVLFLFCIHLSLVYAALWIRNIQSSSTARSNRSEILSYYLCLSH